MNQWPKGDTDEILPPAKRIQPGRPKKKRMKGDDEVQRLHSITKFHQTIRCSKCGEIGHNKATCMFSDKSANTYRGSQSSKRSTHNVVKKTGARGIDLIFLF